ncbi:Bacterial regulatory protein LysR, HTH motif:LysR substrate binding domain [Fulvimarina pelagi HTCC2506]|uniref:Bacterial regulatory protein LysR, HTH motif:LysR substrate binding domain n=1 Tax=Fulvimarina pelagi HTCC2506 TaxID=314231 RepID=Q0G2G4_9HYPH|nr:LysR family transcriptional regulator [Fulvimarina pelagi]EAU41234.1 Bacterial regulatory protein LysR, HTH motif:LysR substrate binding domain [Fulvimarina pelagi HTCC2506]
MNWDDARIFLAVARAGQILGAARRLELNHATVGRRLSALEADIGAKLLHRRPNGCELTAQGRAFLAQAELMEAATISARAEIGNADVSLSGTVRIGAPDGFGTSFLAPRLWRLAERHPNLTIQLVPVPRAFSISRREADIAVTVERPEHGRLVAGKLTDYALGFYAARSYLERHGEPEKLGDLASHRLVGAVEDLLYSPRLTYFADLLQEWPSRFEISSAMGQLEAVAAGAGIGILHCFSAQRRSELVRILPDERIDRAYWLVFHESVRDVARIAAVAEFIREAVETEKALFG